MEVQQIAQLESIVSSLTALHASLNQTTNDKGNTERRADFRSAVLRLLSDYQPDPTAWESVKSIMAYDDYLTGRKVDGSLTEFDLIRPGLLKGQFDSEYAYYEHLMRITASKAAKGKSYSRTDSVAEGEKLCSKCNTMKPASKFRRKGGAVCHACRGAIYRENKKRDEHGMANTPRFFTGDGFETTEG